MRNNYGEKNIDVVLGLQMGDEGKGRYVYLLASEGYDVVARYNGGANAGHTFMHKGKEINTHQVPSGITQPGILNLITLSSYVEPISLVEEIKSLITKGIGVSSDNLKISSGAHLILPHNIMFDVIRETGKNSQGSTRRGIAQVASEKYLREGITAVDYLNNPTKVKERIISGIEASNKIIASLDSKHQNLMLDAQKEWARWDASMKYLISFFADTVEIVHQKLQNKKRILAEGAQSSGLDIEHGARPEVTSSHVTIGGVLNSLGVGPTTINHIYGVAKLLPSRVGGTPASFPTRITDTKIAEKIRGNPGAIDSEYGKSTGRERQVGYLDLALLRRSLSVNGVTGLVLTKLDCVPRSGKTVKIATHYIMNGHNLLLAPNSAIQMSQCKPVYEELPTWKEDISKIRVFEKLPKNARSFVEFIEKQLNVKVTMIGVGPASDQIIDRRI
jgi:adenylosuccinate synthase